METTLKDLLEDFDKALPKPIPTDELHEKHSVDLINLAQNSLLITPINNTNSGLHP